MIVAPSVIILLLLLLICWDLRRMRSLKVFEGQAFHIKPAFTGLLLLVFLAVLIFDETRWNSFPFLVLVTVIPMYLVKRDRFFHQYRWFDKGKMIVSDAFGVLIHWGYGVIVFSLFLEVFLDHFPSDDREVVELLLSAVFSTGLFLILIHRAVSKISDKGFLYNIGYRGNHLSWFKLFFIPAAAGLTIAFFSANLVVHRNVQPQTPLSEALASSDSFMVIIFFLMMALIIAPFVEEVIFRGYFYRVVKLAKGKRNAFFLIALTFAFLHVGQYWGDWLAILMVTLMGFVLTFFRVWSRSIIPSVVTHYAYNIGVTVLPVILLMATNQPYFKYQVYSSEYDARTKENLLKESLKINPRLAQAYGELARLYVDENKKLQEALRLIDQALGFDEHSTIFLDTKAEILTELKRYDEAKSTREKIIDITSSFKMENQQRKKIRELNGD